MQCVCPLTSLSVSGASCDDPGTPPDAVQVGTSYQDGKKVTYTCNRDGFEPDNKNPKTCEVSTWDNINVPNCIGECELRQNHKKSLENVYHFSVFDRFIINYVQARA